MLNLIKQFSFAINKDISFKYFLINNKIFIVYIVYNRLFYLMVPAFLNIKKIGLNFFMWANIKYENDLNQYYSFYNNFFF